MPDAADAPAGDLWSSLGDAKALKDRDLFVAEGRRVIQHVLAGAAGGPGAIVAALATPAAAGALDLTTHLGERLDVRHPDAMRALTGFNFHRGALAIVRRPPMRSAAEVLAGRRTRDSSASDPGPSTSSEDATRRPLYVVGEQIADADNLGSLFRNALAFGAAAVLLDDRSADPLYRKAVRTSLGAVLQVPWTREPLAGILAALTRERVATVGLTPAPAASPLPEVLGRGGRAGAVALLVGNEGAGLSATAQAACDALARIPMAAGADSLNVATAVAVALYECRR